MTGSYITNLPREEFLPADLATLYRCRWEVETLFRELKTQYELDEFDTSNRDVVEILLYAALLSLLVSRELLDLVTEQADDEIVFPPERWAATSGRTPSSSSTNSVSTSATHHRRC
jgi:putative transposase